MPRVGALALLSKRGKMELQLIKLQPDGAQTQYFEQINGEAFPPNERMSLEEMFAFTLRADAEVLGIYDAKTPVGFMFLVKDSECAYLYFLAIAKQFRSKGYGGKALQALTERYAPVQIALDFEVVDESAGNYEQRIKRKAFYLRHGFCETGRYTLLNGERFEVVCNAGELRAQALTRIIGVIHAYLPQFSDRLL